MEKSIPIVSTEQGKAHSAAEFLRRYTTNNTEAMGARTPKTTSNHSVQTTTPQDTKNPGVSRLTSLSLPDLLDALQGSVEAAAARKVERANMTLVYSADHPKATWGLTEAAGQTVGIVEYPEVLMAALIRLAEQKI